MTKYIATGFCVFALVLGWNVMLIERDRKFFESYDLLCKQQLHNSHCKYSK